MDYQHNMPPSVESKLIQFVMSFLGTKKRFKKKMIASDFDQLPANPPKSFRINFDLQEIEQSGRKVWKISPKNTSSNMVVLYLHGGAYMGNITKQHWDLIELLLFKINATIVIPDYPLAPNATCIDTYGFMQALYSSLITDYPTKQIVFMGDSAGGGLALGLVQQLKQENKKQPVDIILFSPWLDIAMTNPDIQPLDKKDKLLSIDGLKSAGQKYAGTLDMNDYRVSPIYMDFNGMPRISIFSGTNDLLNADARKCKQRLLNERVNFNYFEYPEMFHDWVIITHLKESQDVIHKVIGLLTEHE